MMAGMLLGEHIYTVTATDVSVGWTEIRPVLNKAQRWVKESIEDIKNCLPYKMLGIVLQTIGLKFKNYQLIKWCEDNEITFTRGRSYRKNDNYFVEQKNNSVITSLVGYYQYEGQQALEVLEKLYKLWCLLVNYFYSSMKILKKEHKDAHIYKKYDNAKTPYKRCLESDKLSDKEKQKLTNIIELKKSVEKALNDIL